MKTKYYKVHISFDSYISIDESELPIALMSFIKSRPAIFKNGAVSRITAIEPDYVKAMGWSEGYVLKPEDYSEIKRSGCEKAHLNFFQKCAKEVGERNNIRIESNQKLLL